MRISSILSRYLLAFALIVAVTAALFPLRAYLETALAALLYLIPLGLITAYWGLGPGITGAFVAFLSFNYFFIQPYRNFAVHRPSDVVILVIFLIVAIVISQLVGRMKAGLAAATAREREATRLYELSAALSGLSDSQSIAGILARKIAEVLNCDSVALDIGNGDKFVLQLPDENLPARPPEWTFPIQVARGTLGEIRLWRATPALSSEEKRMIQIFASQGALALERARLAKADARARVLEESDKLKSSILSSVSHELRTPLSTIKAAASSLRSGEVGWNSEASRELISAIDDEADHLNMLVGNLLDMSRIESGALKPKRDWNILPEIAESVLSRMKRLAANHKIEVDIPESLPLIPVDYIQMEQVFTNLLSNSVKYAPEDTAIRLQAFVENEHMRVVVRNQGPQVPPELLDKIFDKFFRLTATDRVTGAGLGLSICKGIIEAHGGRLWAENVADGLAFNFTIPLTWEGKTPPVLPTEPEAE